MSTPKHTPGPWEAWKTLSLLGVGKDYGNGSDLCHAVYESNRSDDEQMANMRLMSAAPELLEALEGLLSVVEQNDTPLSDPERIAARAAIAKARGEE